MRGGPYREHPILFNGEMVCAILAGRKTQTRRPIKFLPQAYQPDVSWIGSVNPDGKGGWIAWGPYPVTDEQSREMYPDGGGMKCPFGVPGDHLWVRETTRKRPGAFAECYGVSGGQYVATLTPVMADDTRRATWWYSRDICPSIHMPRWAARLILEVADVRVEQVQDITGHDATLEGWPASDEARLTALNVVGSCGEAAINWLAANWDSIYAKRGLGWDANPWVWVIEFEVVPA